MSETSETAETIENVIDITPAAVAKLAELLAQEDNAAQLALRISVEPGGCSGYTYGMFFDTEIDDQDLEIQASDTVRVVVDPESSKLLQGSSLDFEDGLQGAGFHLNNPNAKKSCGCGKSFC